MRNGMLLIASTLIALGTLELAIRVFDLFAPARTAIAEASLRGARPADAPASAKQLHPFWGWSLRKNSTRRGLFHDETSPGHRNLFGFVSAIDDYRDVNEADFAIGIFGGSVAGGVARWGGDEIEREVARTHPELVRRIRILNFAAGAYKQPQQLMVLSEMILLGVSIDYVVNVDGLNELVLGSSGARTGYHPVFPARWEMRALVEMARGAATDSFYEASAEIIQERRAAEWIESRATGWLFHSELVKALAGALAGRHHRRADELEAGLQSTLAQGTHAGVMASIPDACLGREPGCRELIADVWMRASLLMAAQASSIGAGYLHALQPSQYVPGSKHLTDQERQRAYAPDSVWMRSVQDDYPLLRERGAALSVRGVDFLDLTPSFSEVTDSIYVDTCCHMNPTGYGMLGEKIGKRIATRLASANAVSERPLRSREPRRTDGP
jgi:hypothetical protein